MTEKDLKRLSRSDLLEMLIDQSVELQKTRKKLRIAEKELSDRQIAIDEAGSIAEAALQLNGVFSAAQDACEQYMENIRTLSRRQEAICRDREAQSVQQAADRLAESVRRCAEMERETQEKCDRMLKQAKADAQAYWDEVSQKLDAFVSQHAEVRGLLNSQRLNRDE